MIAGIESGTWLLAEASLLDGFLGHRPLGGLRGFRRSPIRRYVASSDRFVIDGKRMTTGGSLPTLDLMLEVIRRRQGYSLALEVSRPVPLRAAVASTRTSRFPSLGRAIAHASIPVWRRRCG